MSEYIETDFFCTYVGDIPTAGSPMLTAPKVFLISIYLDLFFPSPIIFDRAAGLGFTCMPVWLLPAAEMLEVEITSYWTFWN